MSTYMTEDEQIEAIKSWWKKYNGWVTLILAFALLGFSGVRYLNWHQAKVNQHASLAYEKLMVAFSNQDNPAVMGYSNVLIKEHGGTVYADSAHLARAKLFVSESKLMDAQHELERLIASTRVPSLKQIATIRLSRILIANKAYESALKSLETVSDKAYLPMIYELKGDALFAIGQNEKAREAYSLAMKEVQAQGMVNLFLEMKQGELASLANSTRLVEKENLDTNKKGEI